MAFRGLFFTEEHEHLDVFAVDLHETGPSGGDVHWRGAATGESRASFEGLIQIDPGAQQTHTYLQIHSMMLSPKARIDAIPSVLVVGRRRLGLARRHGRRARRGGDLLHADARPRPPGGGARDRRGLLRAARRASSQDEAPRRARARASRREARGARARTSRRMPPAAESDLFMRPPPGPGGRARGLPDLRRGLRRAAARLPGLGGHLAEAGGRDRRDRRASAPAQREHPPRRVRARAGGRRGRTRARASASPRSSAARRRRTTIFTKNATEAINLVAYAWGRANVGPGDAVLITADGAPREPRAVAGALPRARRRAALPGGRRATASSRSMQLDAELARGDVRLVAFAHVSNVLGTINPVAEMMRADARGGRGLARRRRPGRPAAAGRRGALGADFYAWTGHKALGPTGIGVLHGAPEILEAMRAVPHRRRHDRVGRTSRRSTWNELP